MVRNVGLITSVQLLRGLQPNYTFKTISNKLVFFLYCPYSSSIHEKANCIAIFWTGGPHSIGSCIFEVSGPPVFHIKTGASR